MRCLDCKEKLDVYQTIRDEVENITYRHLQCKKCKKRFKTFEDFTDQKIPPQKRNDK